MKKTKFGKVAVRTLTKKDKLERDNAISRAQIGALDSMDKLKEIELLLDKELLNVETEDSIGKIKDEIEAVMGLLHGVDWDLEMVIEKYL